MCKKWIFVSIFETWQRQNCDWIFTFCAPNNKHGYMIDSNCLTMLFEMCYKSLHFYLKYNGHTHKSATTLKHTKWMTEDVRKQWGKLLWLSRRHQSVWNLRLLHTHGHAHCPAANCLKRCLDGRVVSTDNSMNVRIHNLSPEDCADVRWHTRQLSVFLMLWLISVCAITYSMSYGSSIFSLKISNQLIYQPLRYNHYQPIISARNSGCIIF